MNGRLLEQYALQALAAHGIGQDRNQPRGLSLQIKGVGEEADIRSLPVDTSQYLPLQNDAGVFYFLPDYSAVDGSDIIR